MRELHLFAGIGGGILAGRLLGNQCVGAVEIEPYCRQVLRARQDEGILERFPIHDDIRTFDGTKWRGRVDVLCGGFPCQPWSSAGKRLGIKDPRHLWPEMFRIVSECRPQFVFAENVAIAAFREPWRDLRGLGYTVPAAVEISAGDIGAPFRRKRWWMLAADANIRGVQESREQQKSSATPALSSDANILRQSITAVDAETPCAQESSDSHSKRLEIGESVSRDDGEEQSPSFGTTWRATSSRLLRLVSRTARGMDSRVSRIRAIGNAQVPAVAATAFRFLMRNWLTELDTKRKSR